MGRTSLKAKGMPMSRTDCQRTYRQYMRQLRLPPIGGRTLAFPLRPSLFRLVCPTPKVNRDQIRMSTDLQVAVRSHTRIAGSVM